MTHWLMRHGADPSIGQNCTLNGLLSDELNMLTNNYNVAIWHDDVSSRIRGLILNGADPNTVDDFVTGLNRTALHWAIVHGDISMARWIIRHGADPSREDHLGKSLRTTVDQMAENDPNRQPLLNLLAPEAHNNE